MLKEVPVEETATDVTSEKGDDVTLGDARGGFTLGEQADEQPVEESIDIEMSDDETTAFLERQGWGCLTLADGSAAYSIPMSFGYDGDSTLYFQLQTDPDGEKMAYLDATTTATFLIPKVRPPEWTSVIVRGEVRPVPDDEIESAYAAFAENAWFPACPWTDEKDVSEVDFYELEVEEMTGRSSAMQ